MENGTLPQFAPDSLFLDSDNFFRDILPKLVKSYNLEATGMFGIMFFLKGLFMVTPAKVNDDSKIVETRVYNLKNFDTLYTARIRDDDGNLHVKSFLFTTALIDIKNLTTDDYNAEDENFKNSFFMGNSDVCICRIKEFDILNNGIHSLENRKLNLNISESQFHTIDDWYDSIQTAIYRSFGDITENMCTFPQPVLEKIIEQFLRIPKDIETTSNIKNYQDNREYFLYTDHMQTFIIGSVVPFIEKLGIASINICMDKKRNEIFEVIYSPNVNFSLKENTALRINDLNYKPLMNYFNSNVHKYKLILITYTETYDYQTSQYKAYGQIRFNTRPEYIPWSDKLIKSTKDSTFPELVHLLKNVVSIECITTWLYTRLIEKSSKNATSYVLEKNENEAAPINSLSEMSIKEISHHGTSHASKMSSEYSNLFLLRKEDENILIWARHR